MFLPGWTACVGEAGLSGPLDASISSDEADPEYREWAREKVGVRGEGEGRSDDEEL